ncbi:MAG: YceI family protein [Desulfatibacillaceae bacterium]
MVRKPRKTFFAALVAACMAAAVFAAPAQARERYTVDPVHSSVVFRIKHMGIAWFYGRFNTIVGEFVFDEEQPENSMVRMTVPVKSVDTHNDKRDEHLRSADFFNAVKYPEMSFESNSVERTGPKTCKARGNFTMMGTTRPLTCTVYHTGEGKGPEKRHRQGFETHFALSRGDFGMEYGLDGLLGNGVEVTLSVEGVLVE